MHDDDLLAVFQNFAQDFAFLIPGNSSYGYFYVNIFTKSTCQLIFTTVLTALRFDMPCVTQRQKCPFISITLHDNMTSSPAVTSIRATFWDIFFSAEMGRACTAVTGLTMDFYVIYKIGHNFWSRFKVKGSKLQP